MIVQILSANLNPAKVYECNFKIGKTCFSSAVQWNLQFYMFYFILAVSEFGDWYALVFLKFISINEYLDDITVVLKLPYLC
jgi:hypothetical protein